MQRSGPARFGPALCACAQSDMLAVGIEPSAGSVCQQEQNVIMSGAAAGLPPSEMMIMDSAANGSGRAAFLAGGVVNFYCMFFLPRKQKREGFLGIPAGMFGMSCSRQVDFMLVQSENLSKSCLNILNK